MFFLGGFYLFSVPTMVFQPHKKGFVGLGRLFEPTSDRRSAAEARGELEAECLDRQKKRSQLQTKKQRKPRRKQT